MLIKKLKKNHVQIEFYETPSGLILMQTIWQNNKVTATRYIIEDDFQDFVRWWESLGYEKTMIRKPKKEIEVT